MNLFKTMNSILDQFVNSFVKPIIALMGLLIAILIVAGIVARSIFNQPLFGVEETILLAVIWFYMLGAVIASHERSHLSANFLPNIIKSQKTLQRITVIGSVIAFLMACCFVYWSYFLFTWSLQTQATTPVFGVPWAISQTSPFVCSVLMMFYALRDVLEDLKPLLTNTKIKGES